jgi:hypothetical protein
MKTEPCILFLDIDGVVNSERSAMAHIGMQDDSTEMQNFADSIGFELQDLPYGVKYALYTVDPICVALVNKLLKVTGAHLVLSSTHRMHFKDGCTTHGSEEHLRRLRGYLTAMGFNVPKFFSVTPILNQIRGLEIKEWLSGFSDADDIPYAILDDSRDFMLSQSLVKCNGYYGLSAQDYNEACRYLGVHEAFLPLR